MAVIHRAQLNPGKLDLIRAWGPSQPWWGGSAESVELLGAYRFDDPAGEVGIETHLVAVDGRAVQVPTTYRAAPLDGAEAALIGTTQHSVLGQRWVYDGVADPVYVAVLAYAILTGGRQAEMQVQGDDGLTPRELTTFVQGSGSSDADVPVLASIEVTTDESTSTIRTSLLDLTLYRTLPGASIGSDVETLSGTWPGHETTALLALARRR